jgi:predicted nucleic acid-binding Zn ribbon protein
VNEATPLPPRLKELLSMVGRRLGLDHPSEVGALWGRWREIVGPDVAQHAEPSSLRSGLLRVRTDSPVWATEISYLADEIRRRTNETLGRDLVREVRVWTGPGAVRTARAAPAASPKPTPHAAAENAPEDPRAAFNRARRAWLKRRLR